LNLGIFQYHKIKEQTIMHIKTIGPLMIKHKQTTLIHI